MRWWFKVRFPVFVRVTVGRIFGVSAYSGPKFSGVGIIGGDNRKGTRCRFERLGMGQNNRRERKFWINIRFENILYRRDKRIISYFVLEDLVIHFQHIHRWFVLVGFG